MDDEIYFTYLDALQIDFLSLSLSLTLILWRHHVAAYYAMEGGAIGE